jgi:hypothetical protein
VEKLFKWGEFKGLGPIYEAEKRQLTIVVGLRYGLVESEAVKSLYAIRLIGRYFNTY